MDLHSHRKLIKEEDLVQEPLERAETIPSSWYCSSEIFDFEKEAVFSRHWQLACHISQIPEPGDYMTLEIAGNPILVVRDREGKLRAYYNVCRHRGGPLAVKKGTVSVLQCRYHGWTYLLDGSLRGIPHWDRVDLFDKKDFGLIPVSLQTWQGLIFICLDENPYDLHKQLSDIANHLYSIDLHDIKFDSKQAYLLDCNWKVYVDNYLEGYHIPVVHPELSNVLDYRRYVTETHEWYSVQHSPFKSSDSDNPYGITDGEAYYYFIFPNIMLNILPGRLQTNVVRPISHDETEVLFFYYYEEVESKHARKTITEDLSYSETIQQEDIEICEAVQKGLQSKGYDKGRFSVEREEGVYHFQSLLKKVYRQALDR